MSGFKSRLVTFFAILLFLMAFSLLSASQVHARDWHVPSQALTIKAAVDSAITGDVVVIAAGTYTDCTDINGNNVAHIAIMKNGVDLRGETGDPADVILDANWQGRCLEMRSFSDTTRVTGITFRRGKASNPFGSGGGVFAYAAKPYFKDCVFDSCDADFAGGGVNVLAGELTVENCVFIDCGTDNIGAAIRVTSSPLTVTSTTIFRSRGPALHYASEAPEISQTIIVNGDDKAITRNNTSDPTPNISCTDIWGNEEDWTDFLVELANNNDNISVNPLFCNPLFGDLSIYSTSECSPDFNPSCGLIGARSVVCGLGASTYVIQPNGSGDFPTIQAAINIAANADTIALADGVFTGLGNRNVDFLGKGVVVRGLNRDPELAIIDCEGSINAPNRAFRIFRGESGFSVVSYLTIRNGDVAEDGGAILVENSSPQIYNVIFTANHADRGAALFVNGGDPVIRDCQIIANEGRFFAGGFGFHNSEALVSDSLFRNNWGGRASALYMPDSCTITVSGVTFNANNSAGDRACIEVEGSSVLSLTNCLITNGNRSAVRCFDNATVSASNTNIFGNVEGNWTDCIASQATSGGNLTVDPLYCDPDNFDFTLRGDSKCAPYNALNNKPIGAFGTGCYGPDTFSDASVGLPAEILRSTGVAWIDVNSDGNLDLHVTNPNARNAMLMGNGSGVFTDLGDSVANYSGPSISSAWADYDGDGDLDVYYSNRDQANILAGNINGVFSDLNVESIADSGLIRGSSWADFDSDGDLDLLVVRNDTTCVLYERGSGTDDFADVTVNEGISMEGKWIGSAWGDYDSDGRPDLYLLSDGGTNQLYHNEETGFQLIFSTPVLDNGKARGAAWGDYDNDGKLDILLVNDQGRSHLMRHSGAGVFTDIASGPIQESGPSRSGIWGDYDNDGDLDIFVTQCGQRDRLIRNDGAGKFLDMGALVFSGADSSTGAAWGDYDNDGDLDLVVADQAGATRLYLNNYSGGANWLKVKAVGPDGGAPVPGTRIRIWREELPTQLREISAGGGYYSSDEMVVHFGLGEVTTVDSLHVLWPSGASRALTNVAAGQTLVVTAGVAAVGGGDDGGLGTVPRVVTGLRGIYPNPFNPATHVKFDLASRGMVRIRIYDVAGRMVRELMNKSMAMGHHKIMWRGRDRSDRPVAAGVYFVQLQAAGETWTQGVVLVK